MASIKELDKKRKKLYGTSFGRLFDVKTPYPAIVFSIIFFVVLTPYFEFTHSIFAKIVCILSGLLFYSLIEYFFHRTVFHTWATRSKTKKYFELIHLPHHYDNKHGVNASPLFFYPIFALFLVLFKFVTFSWELSFWINIGIATGFLAYEVIHYLQHFSKSPKGYVKYMTKLHNIHHDKHWGSNYGVTSPLWDIIFKTYRRK